MTDTFCPEIRSRIMSRVKGRDTSAEMTVRRLLHKHGYRYRLHDKRLPGKPDLVFQKRRKVIFVHGCFWHGHENCPRSRRPTSNAAYWNEKLDRNIKRDAQHINDLVFLGWGCLVVWECEMRDEEKFLARLQSFLGRPSLDKSASCL